MENGCLARVNLIGTKGRPETVPGVPLKGLNVDIFPPVMHLVLDDPK
jgi:hypothetical protein